MSCRAPVLAVGWDAADAALVERLLAEGRLPALAALRARGSFGRIGAEPLRFVGGVWPTFYTGKQVPWHGVYHNRLWRAERMDFAMASADWLRERPFWERLGTVPCAAIVDVPMTLGAPRPIDGVQLAGFGTHDLLSRGSHPRSLWGRIRARFGAPRLTSELFGPQTAESLLRLRDQLLGATEQMASIAEWLLAEADWDLFLLVLGAPHRGGHYLWDLSQIDAEAADVETRLRLESSLADVYEACDRALARLVAKAPSGARVLVFALYGMGPNPGWADRMPEILEWLGDGGRDGARLVVPGAGFRLKQSLPPPLRRWIAALPRSARDRVLAPWRTRRSAWIGRRIVPLDMDHAGYVRVNLRGRERHGVVGPGVEYENVCRDLAAELSALGDLASGEPIVDRVDTLDDLAPRDAPYRDLLPDLVVTWSARSAIGSPGVRSVNGNELRWIDPVRIPSGRSGNHRAGGWFVAAGDGIAPGARVADCEIVDVVPTLFRWLGIACPDDLQGRAIPSLIGEVEFPLPPGEVR